MKDNFFRWLLSWALYYAGDLVSRVINWPLGHLAYPLYNWLMLKSSDVQGELVESFPWGKEV